jgi:MFS superfamily sulfate permease-like transporter
VLKLLLAAYLAYYLELVPMACIGGVLLFVAFNMVKPAEVKQVLAHGRFHVALMLYTAVTVILTDFLKGVLSAIIIYVAAVLVCKMTGKSLVLPAGHEETDSPAPDGQPVEQEALCAGSEKQ